MNPTTQSVKFGEVDLKSLTRIVPTEKLEKKWEKVEDRPTPSSEELETLSMLNERWGLAKNAKQTKHDVWNQGYLQYRSVNYYSLIYGGFPTYWNQWGMSVFIPRTFETIESIKTQINGRTPDFTIAPTRPSVANKSQNINHLIKSEFKRSHTSQEITETVHDALLYGSGLVRTDMVNKKEFQQVMSWGEDGSIQYNEQLVTVYSGVGCRRVDPYDFYPNPSPEAYRRDKLGWAFERSVVDAWELREQYEIMAENGTYGVTENWKYIRPGGDTNDYKYLRGEIDNLYIARNDNRTPGTIDDIIGRTGFASTGNYIQSAKGKIELLEYWENDRYVVIANGLILRDSPNPYPHKMIPYIKFSMIDMNEYWPMGMPEVMKWLQITENIMSDQALNNIIMSVHKMFAVNSRYLEDEGELVVRPFGIIHLKQIPNMNIKDAIMPIEYNMNMGNYFEYMRMNKENMQTVTGVSPYMTGGVTDDSKVERATVANRLSFAGQARVREISRHMEDSMVMSVVEDYIAISQFYYQNVSAFNEPEVPVEVESPESTYFVKFLPKSSGVITPEERSQALAEGYKGIIASDEIQGRYTVTVQGGSSLPRDPEDVANMKLKFFDFAKSAIITENEQVPDPVTGQMITQTVQYPLFNIGMIGKEVARDAFDVSNPEDYLFKKNKDMQQNDLPPNVSAPETATVPPEVAAASGLGVSNQ